MSLRLTRLISLALVAQVGRNQLEEITDSGSGGGAIPPAVRTAFEETCGKSGCHSEGATAPPLAGKSLDGILTAQGSGGPLVTLGDTANSYLAVKMLPDAVVAELGVTRTGGRMPLDADFLNPNNQTILAWIAGAEFEGGGSTGGSTGDPTDGSGSSSGSGGPVDASFAAVQAVFDNHCSCHLAAPNPISNGDLELTAGKSYMNLVSVKAHQATTTNRVEPGDPMLSYLWLKLSKQFDTVPGGGPDPMPLGPPLSQSQLDSIEAWIADGAPET